MPNENTAWEKLSVETTQVLLCDLQNEIVARSKTTKPDALRKSAGVLLELAKLFTNNKPHPIGVSNNIYALLLFWCSVVSINYSWTPL